jgi:hypothetical protein
MYKMQSNVVALDAITTVVEAEVEALSAHNHRQPLLLLLLAVVSPFLLVLPLLSSFVVLGAVLLFPGPLFCFFDKAVKASSSSSSSEEEEAIAFAERRIILLMLYRGCDNI